MNMAFYDKKCRNSKFIVGIFLIHKSMKILGRGKKNRQSRQVGILVSLSLIKA